MIDAVIIAVKLAKAKVIHQIKRPLLRIWVVCTWKVLIHLLILITQSWIRVKMSRTGLIRPRCH